MQQCCGLSDEGTEDALYDSQVIRRFVGIDLSRQSAPDATTLSKFRRLLEDHELSKEIFAVINRHLSERGLILVEGTVSDENIIAAGLGQANCVLRKPKKEKRAGFPVIVPDKSALWDTHAMRNTIKNGHLM